MKCPVCNKTMRTKADTERHMKNAGEKNMRAARCPKCRAQTVAVLPAKCIDCLQARGVGVALVALPEPSLNRKVGR